MVTEKTLDKKLCRKIRAVNGDSYKFEPVHVAGMPDRIVSMPGNKIYFVELKSPCKKPSLKQEAMIKILRNRGHEVFIIDSEDALEEFLKKVIA